MRIQKAERNVYTNGLTEKHAFSIKASPQAFKILSDGLYSNKIQAITRELTCNANDSHIAAKNKKPFQVHLPNPIEPWFAVRDWGTGLSHDEICHLYTTYFESTKDEVDDQTGCLGLGSKSPFSYTDQFTVTSWYNGKLRLYSAYIDENGGPQITLMGEPTNTNEPNGLEVKVAVLSEDFHRFELEARKILGRFDPIPTVIGCGDFKPEIIEYLVSGSCWKIRKERSRYSSNDGAHAIQGFVSYPINVDAMKGLTPEEETVLSMPIDIWFDLGELMITASRESLSYGDKEPTTASIKRKCQAILKEIPVQYQHEFDACKTLWDAKLRYIELMDDAPYGIRKLARNDHLKVHWRGQALDDQFDVDPDTYKNKVKDPLLKIMEFSFSGRRGRTVKPRAKQYEPRYNGKWTFRPSQEVRFFYDDMGRGSNARISHFMMESRNQNDNCVETALLIKSDHTALVSKLKKELGNVPIHKVSTLPAPPKNAVTRQPGVKVFKWKGHAYNERDQWEPTTMDFNHQGIYVSINRYRVMRNGAPVERFENFLDKLKNNGIFNVDKTPIYGVYPRYAKKLAKNSNWILFWDHIGERINKIVTQNNLESVIANRNESEKFSLPNIFRRNHEYLISHNEIWNKLKDQTSPMIIFRNAYKHVTENRVSNNINVDQLISVARMVGYKINESNPDYNLENLWNDVVKRYPMFDILQDNYNSYYNDAGPKMKILVDYINLVDAS